MKAIISCTQDEKYSYFIPIVTWTWNKLGVGVVLFLPESSKGDEKIQLGLNCMNYRYKENSHYYFDMPKHKEATAAQCVRLYGACLDLPEDEVLITGDVDMLMFRLPEMIEGGFSIFGSDLVPDKQYPMCYISAKVKDWRTAFELEGKSYQQCLDELMKDRDSISMRSDFWALDQEIAYNKINLTQGIHYIPRTNGQNQFAQNRYDRDDSFILDRLNPDTIDFHMNRPGYEDKNFEIILTILKYHYPQDDFQWLMDYTNAYKQLL